MSSFLLCLMEFVLTIFLNRMWYYLKKKKLLLVSWRTNKRKMLHSSHTCYTHEQRKEREKAQLNL